MPDPVPPEITGESAGGGSTAGQRAQEYVPQPLGVPYGYAAGAEGHYAASQNHGSAGTGGPGSASSLRPPLYYEGDEFLGAAKAPGDIANLQRALARAGLLDAFQIGRWDDATTEAFASLLSLANRAGQTWEEVLAELQQGGRGMVDENGNLIEVGAGEGIGSPLEVRLTDPATLRQTFREAATLSRGQGFDDAQYDSMVAAYQAVERRSQERAHDMAQGAAGDSTYEIINPPDPATWAEEEVRRRDPVGVMSNDVRARQDEFFALIRQGAPVQPSGRP